MCVCVCVCVCHIAPTFEILKQIKHSVPTDILKDILGIILILSIKWEDDNTQKEWKVKGNKKRGDSLVAQRIKHLPTVQETWVRSLGSIPWLGRSPGEGNGYPLQ